MRCRQNRKEGWAVTQHAPSLIQQRKSQQDAEDAPNLTSERLTVTVADGDAFAVRVNGDSMQPQHIDGRLTTDHRIPVALQEEKPRRGE